MQLVFYNMELILELLSLENSKNEKKKFVRKILVFWFVA